MHYSGANSVEMAYQSTPVRRAIDYEVLRSLERWLPGKPPNADFVYFMCVSPAGVQIPPEDVIGVTRASFSFVMPSESMLLTTLRQMSVRKSIATATRPFSSHAEPWPMHLEECEQKSQTFHHWSERLSALSHWEQRQLKTLLVQAHRAHTEEPWINETTMQYVLRHGQRFGKFSAGHNQYTKMESRSDQISRKREEDKWKKSLTPSLNKGTSENDILDAWHNEFAGFKLSEDADLEEIFDKMTLFEDVLFDPTEKETVKMVDIENRVAKPRELGNWRTIKIDGSTKRVVCDCERCNRTGTCAWVACLEVLQFAAAVPSHCKHTGESIGWDGCVADAAHKLVQINVAPTL